MSKKYRPIPGYENYAVTKEGVIKSIQRNLILKQYLLNGYYIVDCFRGSATETLPVHRGVALAWVNNPDPTTKSHVNHIDGNPRNNHYSNLEWVTVSENNYHAVNTGLRNDNIPCRLRNVYTKEIIEFPSLAQMCEFLGMRKDTPITSIVKKKFGSLLSGEWEFKYMEDNSPWFYENIDKPLEKTERYMVLVSSPDGTEEMIISAKEMLKRFQIYDCSSRAIPDLVQYASEKFPDLEISYRDAYNEDLFLIKRKTRLSKPMPVRATKGDESLDFSSTKAAARYFGVDSSTIVNRVKKQTDLDGWSFHNCPFG